MIEDWNELPYSEAVIVNPSVSLSRGSPLPFVDMASVKPGNREVSFSEIREFKGSGSKFQKFDTLMARITPCLENGKIARYFPVDDSHFGHGSTEFIVIRGREGITDNNFAYYLTISPEFRAFAVSQMTGSSGRQRVPTDSLGGFRVSLPPLPEQKAIAHILGTLDEKIELNRKMNETLEAMARAFFKSWFVDFDPVRAKMDGRQPYGMDAETAKLFPDKLVESELGPIPEGWEVKEIKHCCSRIMNGGTPRRNEPTFWENGNIPWLTSGEVRQAIVTKTDNFISEEGLAGSSAKWIPSFSTIVALYGATAGQVSMTAVDLTTNQAICSLVPKKGNTFFNYFAMRSSISELENKAVGSAQQNISKAIVEETKVIHSQEIATLFDEKVEPFVCCWVSNLRQCSTLANLRDTLLPKLLSGELSVAEAEEMAS